MANRWLKVIDSRTSRLTQRVSRLKEGIRQIIQGMYMSYQDTGLA